MQKIKNITHYRKILNILNYVSTEIFFFFKLHRTHNFSVIQQHHKIMLC